MGFHRTAYGLETSFTAREEGDADHGTRGDRTNGEGTMRPVERLRLGPADVLPTCGAPWAFPRALRSPENPELSSRARWASDVARAGNPMPDALPRRGSPTPTR